MIDKEHIRILAEAERLMDEGKVPWVWAPDSYNSRSRLAVAPNVMEELGLKQGQTVNNMIIDAIAELSLQTLTKKIEEIRQKVEDDQLDSNFDFRGMLNEDDS